VYRAIKLNLNLFRWTRALDLALKHKVHVETVLAYRQKYLQSFDREEVNPKFLQYFKQVTIIIPTHVYHLR
jgi:intraflagellar transport protein 80